MPTQSNVARIQAETSAAAQSAMQNAIEFWRSKGIRVAGLVEETHGLPDRVCNAGILRDVVTGSTYSIYLDMPEAGRTCHIDASGAERACAAILAQIDACNLLVLSKFGKLEAAGGGLFTAFASAVDAGTPLLTTVSAKHLPAWNAFAPGATTLPPEMAALQHWWTAVSRH